MKVIKEGADCRAAMKVGIDTAVNLAKVTLGGKGRIVMINIPGGIHSTMDGVTVLKNIALTDDTEDMGVKLVLEAAEKQVSMCGDGTTSVSILLQAIINQGMEAIGKGADSLKVRIGVEKAVKIVVDHLERTAIPIGRKSKEIFQIAKISAHDDSDIAKILSDAIGQTGEHSHITVEESRGIETYIDLAEGVKVNSGWLSPLFINNPKKMTSELDNTYILIYEGKIHSLGEIVGLFDKVNKEANSSLLIISDNLDGDALSSLAINVKRGNLRAVAINPAGHNREDVIFRLKDIAIATGGKVLSPDEGHKLEDVELSDLGFAKKVVVEQGNTMIIGGNAKPEELQERVETIEANIKDAVNSFQEQILKNRIASLTGGVGIIYVGGTLESEAKERKDRMDDALGAVLAALENGVVPGGGISLLQAKEYLDRHIEIETSLDSGFFTRRMSDETIGMKIVSDALELPFRQIISNAGLNPNTILKEIKNRGEGFGYNVITDEYIDMVEEGVLDPAKVEINVVKNASSIATQFLNTEGTITPIINSKL